MFNLRRLHLLYSLARHGTIAAAAETLQLSSPAVSQQLTVLEREAGTRLVERDGRRLRLTDAGQLLVSHTEIVLDQLAAAEADLAAMDTQVSGLVRIAAFPSAVGTLIARAWRGLDAQYGGRVEVQLTEMEPEESLPALESRDVDLAVAHAYDLVARPLPGTYDRRELLREPVAVALPVEDPLHDADEPEARVDLAALADRPWIMSRSDAACREMIQRACGAAGFVPAAVAQCRDYGGILSLVGAGSGVSLVPRLAATRVPHTVALHPLRDPLARSVFALTHPGGDRHPATRVTLSRLESAAARYGDSAADVAG